MAEQYAPCSCSHAYDQHRFIPGLAGLVGRTCTVCMCSAYDPNGTRRGHGEYCEHQDGEKPVTENRSRRCRAQYRQDGRYRQCEIMVTEQTFHDGDHKSGALRWPSSYGVTLTVEEPVSGAKSEQVGGDHYRKFKIQPWDIWAEYGLDAFTGAVIKYLLRDKGNRLEDLKKARHTLDRMIELEEEEK